MTVTIRPKTNGKFTVDIRIRWPDLTVYRERPVVAGTEAKARKWGEQREREILAKGQPKPEDKKPKGSRETVEKWYGRLHDVKEAKGLSSVGDMRARVKNWIGPEIGKLPMAEVTSDQLRSLVTALDQAVTDEEIGWKTALNIWGEVTAGFDEAMSSKEKSLRVRTDNPTVGVRGPDRGVERAKPILFPSEAFSLLSCRDVPLYWRRMYAVALYTGARSNELAALTAADVDLEHERISIVKQADHYAKNEDRPTKTRRMRTIEIEPNLMPLIRWLVDEAGEGRLLRMPPDEDRAEYLRRDLARAKCTRPELIADDKLRAPINFHNLRDTCLTWMAVRGDEPLRIQWRAGHTAFKMTEKYIAQARHLAKGFGTPFPPLPTDLYSVPVPMPMAAE